MDLELLTKQEVSKVTKMCGSNIYRLMKLGEFPKPVKIGTGAVRWVKSEINDHIVKKMAERH